MTLAKWDVTSARGGCHLSTLVSAMEKKPWKDKEEAGPASAFCYNPSASKWFKGKAKGDKKGCG